MYVSYLHNVFLFDLATLSSRLEVLCLAHHPEEVLSP